ncbi:DMT family transporter [Staphylospora marina]|uniref:DMT family transporter n=1 Tax=Staphylospora marina TaxID=2490858 RepID=UPI000F5B8A15|nr:multidrug efflux SMR transporter [Staphylospora marina]
MKPYLWLLLAIMAEVIATFALKESEGFTKPIPGLIVVAGTVTAFVLFSLSLREIPVGIAYAVWSGLGTAGTAIVAHFFWNEPLNASQFAGIFMILAGSLLVYLPGASAG